MYQALEELLVAHTIETFPYILGHLTANCPHGVLFVFCAARAQSSHLTQKSATEEFIIISSTVAYVDYLNPRLRFAHPIHDSPQASDSLLRFFRAPEPSPLGASIR